MYGNTRLLMGRFHVVSCRAAAQLRFCRFLKERDPARGRLRFCDLCLKIEATAADNRRYASLCRFSSVAWGAGGEA
jgi:hypothetical protein